MNDQPMGENMSVHRAGFVSVIGRPNVGKSTLMNAYLGQKISIVSSKPQTTRRRVLGILTLEQVQIIFVDTPGIHKPLHRLGEAMVETARQAIPDADALLWLVDAAHAPTEEDRLIAQIIGDLAQDIPLILGLNKCDLLPEPEREARAAEFDALLPGANAVWVSATRGENRERLLALLIDCLPENPPFYPADQVTDQTERVIAAELIREQALLRARQEVPHAVDVLIDEFIARNPDLTYIHATLIVERDSQKGILLGQGGRMIKAISQAARRKIEEMIETRVYLELWVKVRPKWRRKDGELKRLGYTPPGR